MSNLLKLFGVNLIAFVFCTQVYSSDFRVVTTINPIHSLAAGILDGIATPSLLVKGLDSVHGFQVKPSDAREVEQADVFIWVGPNLESSMRALISNLSDQAQLIELSKVSGLTLLENRESVHAHGEQGHRDHDEEEHHEHEDEDHHGHEDEARNGHDEDHHGHGEGEFDMHIWLDTNNAKLMATEMASSFSNFLPDKGEMLESNLNNVLARLNALDTELLEAVKPIADSTYLVFHDAYQYLEKKFDLRNVGAVTVNPERNPGAKKITELRETITETGAQCIFSEPQFNSDILNTIAEGTGIKFGVLDPLGSNLEPGADAYFELMRDLVQSLRDCLS